MFAVAVAAVQGCCHQFGDLHGLTCQFLSLPQRHVRLCDLKGFWGILRLWGFTLVHEAQLLGIHSSHSSISCEPRCSLSPTLTCYFHFKAFPGMLWLLQHGMRLLKSKRSVLELSALASQFLRGDSFEIFYQFYRNSTYSTCHWFMKFILILEFRCNSVAFRFLLRLWRNESRTCMSWPVYLPHWCS